MGSYYIWIIVSVIYGLISGLSYALIARYRRFRGNFWRRFIVWTVIYTAFGLLLSAFLHNFLAD